MVKRAEALLVEAPGDETAGPVRFEQVSPGGDGGDLVLYIPDIDFAGVLAAPQFPGLARAGFELWRCFVGADDRSAFAELQRGIEAWLGGRLSAGRKVIIVGEAFGGLLALAVAMRLGRKLKGFVLVNPATDASGTALPAPAPLAAIAGLGRAAAGSLAGGLSPSAALRAFGAGDGGGDELGMLALRGGAAALGGRAAAASLLAGTLPRRLRAWLRPGQEVVESELRGSAARCELPPALLVCSGDDKLRPSAKEGERLGKLLKPRCPFRQLQVLTLESAGHEPLADRSVDLAHLLQESPICKKTPDYVTDFSYPTLEDIEEGSEGVEGLASILSPVFCSTGSDGKRAFGLAGVPTPAEFSGRPVLLVGNHQLGGLDLGPLVREFLIEKGVTVRGLAFPGGFGAPDDPRGFEGLAKWGAVPVTPRNIFRLLHRGEMVLLFPGGMSEALHGPGEEYQLFWPEKTEFVRVAARFKAVVVPFGGVGVSDNALVFGRGEELQNPLQLIRRLVLGGDSSSGGDGAGERSNSGDGSAGRDGAGERGALLSVRPELQRAPTPPLAAPRLLPATAASPGIGSRFYMSFGSPVDLQGLDPNDRTACGHAYAELKAAVEAEISWLLEKRTSDPYGGLLQRQLYERLANLDATPRSIGAGPLRGREVRNYSARAPAFPLDP